MASASEHGLALKPNPHPYAIKTTHTALLSRSNSSGNNTPSKYFYTPPPTTLSRNAKDRRHEYRGHRYSTNDLSLRRPRADTLPSYLADNDHASPTELSLDPETWASSQLSEYLTTALRIRSGERLPERVACDIASWVRREGVNGSTFLRWTEEDLKALGVNTRWRRALLAAASNLQQNVLQGRTLDNQSSDQEQEPEENDSLSSPLDFPRASELADPDTSAERYRSRRMRLSTNVNGRVRGMVDKWERESVGSSSDSSRRCGSESDSGSELGEHDLVAMIEEDIVDACGGASNDENKFRAAEAAVGEEPSIEDLLAAQPALTVPKDNSWGGRAWEEFDVGVTVRRLETHDTVVAVRRPPRDDRGSSGSDPGSANAGRNTCDVFTRSTGRRVGRHVREVSNNNGVEDDAQAAGRRLADVFAVVHAEGVVQPDAESCTEEAEAEEECVLENEVHETRCLLEEFKRRLEVVEARVDAMEVEWSAVEDSRVGTVEEDRHDTAVEVAPERWLEVHDTGDVVPLAEVPKKRGKVEEPEYVTQHESADSDTKNHVAAHCHAVDLGPTTVSDLPSYVLLVGLGVCTVVLQVVLKHVTGRSLRS
ncbi:hypothetical protein BGW80DRAFT_1302194 [Lactifluus volemus]|nr:hypothetical protein BGW80DRAFT_1302194 [Lactifluus volemus]